MTISTLQLGVGSLCPSSSGRRRTRGPSPRSTAKDIVKLLPVAFCAAGAHAGSVFALSAGAVSFGQIVKAAEPAFAAVVGTKLYGKKISKAKWLSLIPVIGGVCLASLKGAGLRRLRAHRGVHGQRLRRVQSQRERESDGPRRA